MQMQDKRRYEKKTWTLERRKEPSFDAQFDEAVWGEYGKEGNKLHAGTSLVQALACSRASVKCKTQTDEPPIASLRPERKATKWVVASSPAHCQSTWSLRKKFGAAWLVCWLAVAVALLGFGWAGNDNSPVAPATQVSYSQSPTSTSIELLAPGQKVMGDRSAEEMAGETQVDPQKWRLLSLRSETVWADGTIDDVNVETIQPPQWIAEHNAQVGATVPIPLELVEMGLPAEMTATVVANEPCPEIESGPGRVVLTTVNHLNNDLWELTVASPNGPTETVRPTGLHKFYRPADDAWVSTKDLQVGDELQGADGPLVVRRVAKIPGVHRVYNLTVEGEHVYRVSTLGALVHNNGCAQPPLKRIHPDSTYASDPDAAQSLAHWRTRPTDEIVDSLKPGVPESLKVKPDGRMLNGNTRTKVLQERGFDINSLPREVIDDDILGDLFPN